LRSDGNQTCCVFHDGVLLIKFAIWTHQRVIQFTTGAPQT